MRTETGVNERDLLGLWVIHCKLATAALERKQGGRRMARPFFAERWIVVRANSGGNPHSAFFIEHRIVHVGLAVPDGFVPPIRRGRHNLVVSTRRSLRIA